MRVCAHTDTHHGRTEAAAAPGSCAPAIGESEKTLRGWEIPAHRWVLPNTCCALGQQGKLPCGTQCGLQGGPLGMKEGMHEGNGRRGEGGKAP